MNSLHESEAPTRGTMKCTCSESVRETYGNQTINGVSSCKFCLKPLEGLDTLKKNYRATSPPSKKSGHRTINHDVLREVERINEIKAKMTDVEKLNYELQEKILEALLILVRQLGKNASAAPNASTAVSVASFIPTINNIIESLEED